MRRWLVWILVALGIIAVAYLAAEAAGGRMLRWTGSEILAASVAQ